MSFTDTQNLNSKYMQEGIQYSLAHPGRELSNVENPPPNRHQKRK
ncbi:hypothetical protein [Rubritalea tangerina]